MIYKIRDLTKDLHFEAGDHYAFLANCIAITLLFFTIQQYWKDSRKKQAWFIMLLSSSVLSVVGLIYAICAEFNELHWTDEYIYGDDVYSRNIMIFFLSCNVMDLTLGWVYYREFLYPLTTIFHHMFFITISLLYLANHTTRGFLLIFVIEVPTFLLSVGTIWPSLRSDLAFGITFLLTRISYHAYMLYRLASMHFDGLAWKSCFMPFLLHMFWFYSWCNTYFFKKKKTK
mmetsp:Transcript_15320/g.23068  ORF Transcript_15320/g.23068 Transcript_15320/m.23068 type:complete len:230 (+) Transcript_15320:173-862(+)